MVATGVASLDGLTALAIGNSGGVKFRVVNFEGTPDTISALLGGHIDAMGMSVSEVVPYMQDGSMRPMGVGGSEQNAMLPGVPTFAEQGFPLEVIWCRPRLHHAGRRRSGDRRQVA